MTETQKTPRTGTETIAENTAEEAASARHALRLILAQANGHCENLFSRTPNAGACFVEGGRTADARYGIDRACPACIAHYGLTGQPIPLDSGRHADRG